MQYQHKESAISGGLEQFIQVVHDYENNNDCYNVERTKDRGSFSVIITDSEQLALLMDFVTTKRYTNKPEIVANILGQTVTFQAIYDIYGLQWVSKKEILENGEVLCKVCPSSFDKIEYGLSIDNEKKELLKNATKYKKIIALINSER